MSDELLRIAAAEIGTTESPANSNNVKYNTWYYGHAVSGSDYAWCMAFVQWCYNQVGEKLPYATASCSGLLNWYKANQPECVVSSPQPGDIIIYNFGHTGIVESSTSYTVTAIEGNTSSTDAGSQSNGGGVFRRTRSKSKVTAYIRPRTAAAVPTAANYRARVTATSLNCRKSYTTASAVVTTYILGDVLTITQECNGFGYTGVGWVSLKYVSKIEQEDDDIMTGEQIYNALREYLASGSISADIRSELTEAVGLGITDGSNPTQYVTRAQAAVMAKRAYAKAKQ